MTEDPARSRAESPPPVPARAWRAWGVGDDEIPIGDPPDDDGDWDDEDDEDPDEDDEEEPLQAAAMLRCT